jgi:hypothetical protein
MNQEEYAMIETLDRLKNAYGVIQLKAEFENEGSRQVELMRLKDIADAVGLPIILKIGGCEAVTDIYEALSLGAKGIIAPMVETPFAVSKFLGAIETFVAEDNRKDIEFAINIETKTAVDNLIGILSLPNINILSSVTFGRVDFMGSVGADRSLVDSPDLLRCCYRVFNKVSDCGLGTALGGAISHNSKNFIHSLVVSSLLDKYETRKIVYGVDGFYRFDEGLTEGIRFELQWLKSKRRYYSRIAAEDEKRIKMIEERLNHGTM